MRCCSTVVAIFFVGLANCDLNANDSELTPDVIRDAISKSIPLLEKGSSGSADHRQCFTCHSQAIPVFALSEARRRGFNVDEDNLERQLKHTETHLARGQKNYLKGKGQGGGVITAGYALWALEAGGRTPDDTTAAVTNYLLEYQKDANHWRHPGKRPPSSGSDFTTTYVALRGLAAFGTEQQQAKSESRKKVVRSWLLKETAKDTEDRIFRLRSLVYADAPKESTQKAISNLLDSQRSDGGWSQTADMKSDAYATGTAIVALVEDGGLPADHENVRRGIQYLVNSQLDDGSWHVVTRAKGFQTYFESGFPHGKDQFISVSASGWATLALLNTLPKSPSSVDAE
jgi:hypothetical protein